MNSPVFSVDRLVRLAADVLTAVGVSTGDAWTCAQRLVEGEARGQRAHGLARLAAYVRRIESGGIDAKGRPDIAKESPVSALVDGHNALGPVVMTYATEVAADKARQTGLAWVGVRHSNHAGAGGVYAQLLVDQNLVSIVAAVANTNQMAPWGGIDRLLGPNPLTIGIPAANEPPMILDMATSTVSFGTVRQAIASGRELHASWLIDDKGRPVTNPTHAEAATLTPIGGYKGYGLSLIIATLAGTLNGAAAGSEVVDHYQDLTTPTNTGHLIIALNPALFRPVDEFKKDVDFRIQEIRDSTPMDGVMAVQIPGDRSAASRQRAQASGIIVGESLREELVMLATRFQIDERLAD